MRIQVNYFTLILLGKRFIGTDAEVSVPIDMKVLGTRKYTGNFNFKCHKQRGRHSACSSMSTKNQSMPHGIIYTSLADTTSEKTKYHLLIIHKEILI